MIVLTLRPHLVRSDLPLATMPLARMLSEVFDCSSFEQIQRRHPRTEASVVFTIGFIVYLTCCWCHVFLRYQRSCSQPSFAAVYFFILHNK